MGLNKRCAIGKTGRKELKNMTIKELLKLQAEMERMNRERDKNFAKEQKERK